MAIQWGPFSKRIRLGFEATQSPATVGPGTSSVTVTLSLWFQATYAYAQTQTVSVSGSAVNESFSYAFSSANGVTTTKKIREWSVAVPTSYAATVTRTWAASVGANFFDGARPTASGHIEVARRPPSVPDPATSVTATYVSDSRINLAWVAPASGSTDAKRIAGWRVTRWRASTLTWATVASLPAATSSWADTTVSGNDHFRYGVYATNATGESAGVNSGFVSTTPAAPSVVVAAKDAAGDIVVTWQDNSLAETGFEVQDEETTLAASHPASPYTHGSPNPSVPHRYRVRAVAEGPRYSPWSAYSNTVQLITAPAAPTNLAPNGVPHPADESLVLSWSHNPVDTTPQTAYELQHRLVGAGSWTTLTGTTAQQRTVTGYSAGASVEWQVRTKGAHADWSPYSATATFTVAARPTATLSSPGATVTAPSTTVTWGYFQAGGQPQTGWEAEVTQGATVVARQAVSSAATSWTTPNVLADGGSYTARVRVRSSAGLWSAWASQAFTVDYLEPAPSVVDAAWQDGYGNVTITATAASGAGLPATVSQSIERSTDGGNTWVLLIDGLDTDETVIDWQSPAAGTFHYRVKAFSALPSMAETVVEVTVADSTANCVVWVSGGPGFALACPLAYNPTISHESGRERALHAFSGRSVPVEFSSRQVPTSMRVEASYLPDSYVPQPGGPRQATRGELEDLFAMPGPHLYRDPYGRVMYGTLSGLSWSREPGGMGRVSFTLTRSAPPNRAQADSMAGYYAPRIAEVAPGVYRFINADATMAEPGVFEEITG